MKKTKAIFRENVSQIFLAQLYRKDRPRGNVRTKYTNIARGRNFVSIVHSRVQRFKQLGSPRPLIFKKSFEPFRPRLHSKFVKSANLYDLKKFSSE
jgi:hypothetical protein